MREVQSQAIEALLTHDRDLLIAATTAAGKTEAAFLPLLSVAAERKKRGVSILYVAPMKALINDQYQRLHELCCRLDLPLVRWHGDAPAGHKQALLKEPRGVVLITPESLEAMFVRRPGTVEALFGDLEAIVIDELHAFFSGPRGLHLWSLLRRVEVLNEMRPKRIGLSATLGDLDHAADWLSGTKGKGPARIVVESEATLEMQVRAYTDASVTEPCEVDDTEDESALAQICEHAFSALRGKNNLFFAGSRAGVEEIADRLRRRSGENNVPIEFFPHHGNLAKELREETEARLKRGRLPTTAITTTTLELGIDIGSVHAVAQLGPPRSLSALRQRLGRSGRMSGTPARFRNYLRTCRGDAASDPIDRLHLPIAQSVAAMNLLQERFVEPPATQSALLSVALQQVLSLLVERGAMRARALYTALCEDGPFSAISANDFGLLLRGMALSDPPLLEQALDGVLMLGPLGEKITGSREFYVNFPTEQEWRIISRGKPLGTLPISHSLSLGSVLSFAGCRWRVIGVDEKGRLLEVGPHPTGRVPQFRNLSGEPIHNRLAGEIRAVLQENNVPAYLDPAAADLLVEGRAAYEKFGFGPRRFIPTSNGCHVMTWRGTETNALLAVLMTSRGLDCEPRDMALTVHGAGIGETRAALNDLKSCPSLQHLSHHVRNLSEHKYDDFIPRALLRRAWSQRNAHLADEITSLVRELKRATPT